MQNTNETEKKLSKGKSTKYAASMLLAVSAVGLAGCGAEQSFEECINETSDAESCVDLLDNEESTVHHGGGFFYFGGVYSSDSGKYYGGKGKYSHSKYDKSVGKSKYSSVRTKGGSVKASSSS